MLVIIFVWGFVEKLLVTKKTIKNERIKKKLSYKQQLPGTQASITSQGIQKKQTEKISKLFWVRNFSNNFFFQKQTYPFC